VGDSFRVADDDPPQPEGSDTEGATTGRESGTPTVGESGAPTGRESGAPTGEDLGGSPPDVSPPGREVPPPDGGGSTPPAQPTNPKQAEIEAEWDASGIPIAPKAKEYAGEEGIRPGETPPGRGLEVNGVNKITKRDVRDAVGERNRKKRKKEKEEARNRALQPNREASEEAESSEPPREAAEPETAPRSDEETGEAGGEAPIEAEESEAAALEASAPRGGDDDDLPSSEVEPGADSRPPYMGLFEEPDS
jgi:hypothetical protein